MPRAVFHAAIALSVLLVACKEASPPAAQGGPPPVAVTVETVTPQIFPINFEYVGRLEASREVEIRPRVSGVIQHRY